MQIKKITTALLERLNKGLTESKTPTNVLTDYLNYPAQKLYFTEEAWQKMYALIDTCQKEIGWHGLVKKLDENSYQIYDIFVYPQTTTATTITCDDAEFNKWMSNFIMDPEFPFEDLRMHGHSHVNMRCFPSGTDQQLQDDLTKHLKENDFYIFLICNKQREIWAVIHDNAREIIFETNDIIICPNEQYDWAAEQIKENIKEQKVTTWSPSKNVMYTSKKDVDYKIGDKTYHQEVLDDYLDKLMAKENGLDGSE